MLQTSGHRDPTTPGLEDLSGHSVLFKNDAAQLFHTYLTCDRAYRFLDVTPKGLNKNGSSNALGDWVRLTYM